MSLTASNHLPSKATKRQLHAFSLLEVLVALMILSFGMLGIARMLLVSHKANASSYLRQQAIHAAYSILDRIHANRQAAINGQYNVSNLVTSGTPTLPSTPSTNCASTTCSAADLASYDTWNWLTTYVAQLPNGCGAITSAPAGTNTLITVTVQWDDSPTQRTLGVNNPTPSQFIVSTEL